MLHTPYFEHVISCRPSSFHRKNVAWPHPHTGKGFTQTLPEDCKSSHDLNLDTSSHIYERDTTHDTWTLQSNRDFHISQDTEPTTWTTSQVYNNR